MGSLQKMGRPLIFGMVHLRALPGTPRGNLSVGEISQTALREAEVLLENKVDGLIIENMHDVPYQRRDQRGPETVAIMAKIGAEIRNAFPEVSAIAQILKNNINKSDYNRHSNFVVWKPRSPGSSRRR